jgi:hypothetical protein
MDKASEGSAGSGAQDSARDIARDATREGRRLAAGAMAEAKTLAEDVADRRKTDTAEYLSSVSAAILGGGEALREEGYGTSADVARQVGDQIGGLADDLVDREPGELLREVERFARERPALFVGGVLLAGIGVARFLRSSPEPDAFGESGGWAERAADATNDPDRRTGAGAPATPGSST